MHWKRGWFALSPRFEIFWDRSGAAFELATGKFRWRHGFAVVLDDDAARQKILCNEKSFNRTGEAGFDGFAVGGDGVVVHENRFVAISI